jgi:ABC-2 type transport system permease protein
VANQDAGELAGQVIKDLRTVDGLNLIETVNSQPLTAEKIDSLITDREYLIGIDFPSDFSQRVYQMDEPAENALPPTVRFIVDPTANNQILSPARGMVEGFVERVTSYARMKAQTRNGFDEIASQLPAGQQGFVRQIEDEFTSGLPEKTSAAEINYQVVSPSSYKMEVNPTSVEQNVPAYTIYGVFFIIQTIAVSFFEEKNSGAFRRLIAAPLSKSTYLIGKGLSYYVVNLVQILLMFSVGVLVFHINLGHSPVSMIVISLVTSAAATGMGMLLTTLVKSLDQANSMGTMLGVVLSVIGGMMVPAYVMPKFMQTLSWFTPHAWALSAYQDVIVRGLGFSSILPEIGVLGLIAVCFWALAIWRFQFE